MAKVERFTAQNLDLERLATRIETYLQENSFEVAYSKDPTESESCFFIQARKVGALRTMAGARRSTDIGIRGKPNNFEVFIGTGEWGKNMLMSVPLFIVPAVGIVATVAKFYAGRKFESNLWKYIRDQIRFLSNSSLEKTAARSDTRAYHCDYVEGYPGWKSQVEGGRLLLERQRDGKNGIVFRADSREITIPAENVSNAQIIARRKGLHEDDLMIQITCRDPHGRMIKPVFNLNDDIITGVLAGITELVGEDKTLRDLEHASVVTEVKFCPECDAQNPRAAKFCTECGARQQ